VANTILSYGGRIQGSVYELWITDRQYEQLWFALGRLIKEGDLVRAYRLCGSCVDRTTSFGMDNPHWTPGLIV